MTSAGRARWSARSACSSTGAPGRRRSGRTFETVNPATEEVLGVVADAGAEDLDDAIGAARRAFDDTDLVDRCGAAGARAPPAAGRLSGPRRRAPGHDRGRDGLAALLHLLGPARRAGRGDSGGWPTWPRATSGRPTWGSPRRWASRRTAGSGARPPAWSAPSPRGTSPTRSTWPSSGPALAAGNTVVLKPAPDTPWCATVLGPAHRRGDRHPAGRGQHRALVGPRPRRPAVRRPPGRPDQLHRLDRHRPAGDGARLPESLKKVFLELGGKSAFVILDDADLRGACATAAFTVCTHAGQGCAITTRLVVPRRHFDEAVDVDGQGAGQAARPATPPTPAPSAAR